MEETSIRTEGKFDSSYGRAMEGALADALALDSHLTEAILQIRGMSGRLYRRFINRLVTRVENARYLEVGSWAGSTACSAMFGNALKITCIDNWSEFTNFAGVESPREAFRAATSMAINPDVDLTIIESDFRLVDYSGIGRHNIYLFDGPHDYKDQYDGIAGAQAALDDLYIQIVDDWNWPYVRQGTLDAINMLDLKIECSIEVKTTQDDTHPTSAVMENSAWHNGYFIALMRK